MRILQWAFPHHPPLGGKEVFTERLSLGLRDRGHQVLLIADSLQEDSQLHTVEKLSDDVEIHRLNISSFGQKQSAQKTSNNLIGEIKQVINTFNPELIHFHNFYSKSLVFLSAYLRGRNGKIPTIYTLHDIEALAKIPPALGGELIGNLTDVIVSPSKYIHDRFVSIDSYATKRAEVIYNGVPVIADLKKAEKLQIIAAASFENHKGLVILLTAWEKIHSQFPDVVLVLAGDGRDRAFLVDYAQKLGIGGCVEFPGWLSAKELEVEFSKDSVVIVPSLIAEAFGLVAAEAQMAGLPVVASDIGGLKEVIEHEVSGFLVPPGSAVALANALSSLLSDKNLRRTMGHAGRERAHAIFTMEKCVINYEKLFQDLLSQAESNN